jgi:hypothetical protein
VIERLSVVDRELSELKAVFEGLKAESKRAKSRRKYGHKKFKNNDLSSFKVAVVAPVGDSD